MKDSKLLINEILNKINEAADQNKELTLSVEEVKELHKEVGDLIYIPVLSMKEAAEMSRNGEFERMRAAKSNQEN